MKSRNQQFCCAFITCMSHLKPESISAFVNVLNAFYIILMLHLLCLQLQICLTLLVSNIYILAFVNWQNVLNAFSMFSVLHLLKNQPPLSGDQLQGMSISMQDFQVRKSCLTEFKLKSYTNSGTSLILLTVPFVINSSVLTMQFVIESWVSVNLS